MTTAQELQEEIAEAAGLILAEHIAVCCLCAEGGPCPDADEMAVAALEIASLEADLSSLGEADE